MRAIGKSPDQSLIAILRPSFDVVIYDMKKDQLSTITGLTKSSFIGKFLDIDPFENDEHVYEFSEANFKD